MEGRRFTTLIVDALTLHGTSTGTGTAHRRELSAFCAGLQVSSLANAPASETWSTASSCTLLTAVREDRQSVA